MFVMFVNFVWRLQMVVITVIAMKQAINNLLLKYMLKKVDISGLVYSGLCQSCLNGSFSVLNNSEGIDNAFDSLLDCEAMYKSESKTNGDNIASTDDEINFYFFLYYDDNNNSNNNVNTKYICCHSVVF